MQLPYEVLALVFTYLPHRDLDRAKLVCKLWRDVATDKIWKQQFQDHYGTTSITRVAPATSEWRTELLLRAEVLQKWRRAAKNIDITFNSSLVDISDLFPDFSGNVPRVVSFNSHKGMGSITDLDRGKIIRKLYASKYSHQILPISSIDGSRFGLVYGFYDGDVATVAFTRNGTLVAEYNDLPYRHPTVVSAVWIAKSRSFSKRVSMAASVASGSSDGTIILNGPTGHRRFRPSENPVVLLEGTLYGSYAANDGDTVISLDNRGGVYRMTMEDDSGAEHLAQVPFDLGTAQHGVQLHICNDYVIVQTLDNIYAIDLQTKSMTEFDIPAGAKITAFAIDKSYAPGYKYLAAGLTNNEIYTWVLPPLASLTVIRPPPTIEAVNSRSSTQASSPVPQPESFESTPPPSSADASNPLSYRYPDESESERALSTTPLWALPNPIGYDHRLTLSERPQITQLALNAAVLLVGGYNGVVAAMDVLSGRPMKRVNSRISKNVLDLLQYNREGLVPVTHLEVDPNPMRMRGVIATRPAIQYFDLGNVEHKSLGRPTPNHKHSAGSKSKARGASSSASMRHELEEEIELRRELASLDDERDQFHASLRENYAVGDLGDDEQLEYALMLSQQAEAAAEALPGVEVNAVDDVDDDLRLALQLSSLEVDEEAREAAILSPGDEIPDRVTPPETEAAPSDGAANDDDDEDLRRAIELSLQQQ